MDHLDRSRRAYGGSADLYLEVIGSRLSDGIEAASDLDLLTHFVRERTEVGGLALDAGCGTGRVARLLADHGARAIGVDIAVEMLEIARREHPDVHLAVGRLDQLPVAERRVGALVSWYSVITTPPDEFVTVFDEFRRVAADGGSVLVAFQSGGGEPVERPCAYGTDVDLTLYRHDPAVVAESLRTAGFDVDAVVERPREREREDGPQAFVTASARRRR